MQTSSRLREINGGDKNYIQEEKKLEHIFLSIKFRQLGIKK